MHDYTKPLPSSFKRRRLQSIMGFWLVGYLIFHLLTNSQAALFLGKDGKGFVKAVNDIHSLPFLPILEVVLLLIPFLIHIIWGLERLWMAKFNSFPTDGTNPALTEYPRNHAFTWQRITSWILLVLITFHVVQMRFIEHPSIAHKGVDNFYMVRLNVDNDLYSLAERLGATLYDPSQVTDLVQNYQQNINALPSPSKILQYQTHEQLAIEEKQWIAAMTTWPLQEGQVIAVSKDFATAELLMVRETFKMPLMVVLYTVLVLSACFHAFNGLWTFCITWGITLSKRSQKLMRSLTILLMVSVAILGLMAIWGTYWINSI
jgi:succinate dehydrogenase / fumarate reductase cytochrome b subunit